MRYFHTLRYLKPAQLYGRVWFRINHPKPDLRPPPSLRSRAGRWRAPARRKGSMVGPLQFNFLNKERELKSSSDWNNSAWEKLWLYNLHYFDDLNAEGASSRSEWHLNLMRRWIAETPPPAGNGWEPYPLSLRIVNWIKWGLDGNTLPADLAQSLAVQSRYLYRRLETHLFGNHLFSNAKALVFSGLFFQGPESDQWLDKGLQILARETREQILIDGGHFERSPMYHSIILEDLLDLLNLAEAYASFIPDRRRSLPEEWRGAVQRMRVWLRIMSHPDGEIVLFNDSAFNIAPSPKILDAYAIRLDLGAAPDDKSNISFLRESGYCRLRKGVATAFLDVAPIGPDYLPAHAHADTLSFELSILGRRVIVDSGASIYENGAERSRQRGTAAHNTVVIDGQDSSEIWSAFRVARRARVFDIAAEETESLHRVRAVHDGYRRLPQKALHERTWELGAEALVVTDFLKGEGDHSVEIALHLHPDIRPLKLSAHTFRLENSFGESVAFLEMDKGLEVSIVDSAYHPEFGRSIRNQKVAGFFQGALPVRFVNRVQWDERR